MTVESYIPVLSVAAVYFARMVELRTKRATIPGVVAERSTLRMFLACGTVMLAGSLVEYFLRGGRWNPWLFGIGWGLALASFWIRRQAIKALGKFWSLHVEIRAGHEFVRTGPFRWVRHPAYLSMVLELVSVAFTLSVWGVPLVVLTAFFAVLFRRIQLEERALVSEFGQRYSDYRRSTPAIIPWRLRIRE